LAYESSLCLDEKSAQVTQTRGHGEISSQQYLIPLQGPSEREHLIPRLISFLCLQIPSDAVIPKRGLGPSRARWGSPNEQGSSQISAETWARAAVRPALHPSRMRAACRGTHGVTWDVVGPFSSPSTRWDTDPSHLLLLSLKMVSKKFILMWGFFFLSHFFAMLPCPCTSWVGPAAAGTPGFLPSPPACSVSSGAIVSIRQPLGTSRAFYLPSVKWSQICDTIKTNKHPFNLVHPNARLCFYRSN